MKVLFENAIAESLNKKNISLLLLGVILVIPLIFILKTSLGFKGLVFLLGIMLGIVSIYSFYVSYFVLVFLLFTPYISPLHTAVLYTIFVLFSFILNFYSKNKSEIKNTLIIPFLIYFATTLPSFINTSDIILSAMGMLNLIALFIVMMTTSFSLNTNKRMMNLIYYFLTGVLLNGLVVIFIGVTTGKRVFGLLDVFYVDYAGLGSLIALIIAIYSKGLKKIFWGIIALLILYSLILTQTRNAWLSFGVSFIILVIFIFFNSGKLSVKKSYLIGNVVIICFFIGIMYFSVSSVNTQITSRMNTQMEDIQLTDAPESVGESSLMQRFFIWHTAIVAFTEHPIIGIGAYSFPKASKKYYKIPKSFYKTFVYEKTSHITYLSVLTETGLIGFVGFLIFLFSSIRLLFRNIKLLSSPNDVMRTLIICFSMIYITISMFMTDAWLWGQQVVIWAIFLGLLVANYGIIKNKNEIKHVL